MFVNKYQSSKSLMGSFYDVNSSSISMKSLQNIEEQEIKELQELNAELNKHCNGLEEQL